VEGYRGRIEAQLLLGLYSDAMCDYGRVTARVLPLVTSELVSTSPILAGDSLGVLLVPGRTVEIPVPALAGETIAIATSSKDYWDSIAVLLAPDGSPVVGADDANGYFAAFQWPAAQTATYRLWVTFFDVVNSGLMVVARK
jgi:hypothetical protein